MRRSTRLEASEGSSESWTHALRQGTERLMALAKDSPMAGPRSSGEDEDARVGPAQA